MTVRPILFSGPMVRAILEGRKTQTRRLYKPLYPAPYEFIEDGQVYVADECGDHHVRSVYGLPGDRLYVRERVDLVRTGYMPPRGEWAQATYAADGALTKLDTWPWKRAMLPGIHMPRGLSRITLEVSRVRAERLQDISEADARAEGLRGLTKDGGITVKYGIPDRDGLPGTDDDGWPWQEWETDPRKAYAKLWDRINGKRAPWSSNPWVWAVEWTALASASAGQEASPLAGR